ncbi:MAG: ATP-binding cassette domain-containing protein [Eubacteriales bacterium]|nr:ATP-binding cassette domain-containing protein [Eubacteriales bacterium]
MGSLVEMRNITKKFPGVTALSGINFDVQPGETHILLGENGAGKSTLMKTLSGAYEPTEGTLIANGKEYSRFTPKISQENGISIIYQELSVINEISIQENIFVGKIATKKICGIPVVDNAYMRKRTQEVLKEVGLKRDPSDIVGSLSISEKQMVEIAKAVAFDAKVIIMDEPTSSLATEEINHLFDIVERLKKQGRGIVFISHKLDEVLAIGDRVTILKDGTYVGTFDIADMDEDKLVRLMVGREIKGTYLRDPNMEFPDETILEVDHLTRADERVRDISFRLKKGEILGFSGLVGAGRTELMEAIFGARKIKSGTIRLYGEELHIKNTYDALCAGIALVTENRRETGFSPFFSIKRNLAQAVNLKESSFGGMTGLISNAQEQRISDEQCAAMQVKCASAEQIITELSGGNQQKVILGRWMASNPKVIIFDEPTKGIDVGTKSEIYKLMRKLAEQGIGVLVVSSELPEILSTCDRILVMNDGKINGEFTAAEANEENLVRAATA